MPGATSLGAVGGNSLGQLAGYSDINYEYFTPTVWTNGVPVDIGNASNRDYFEIATDINNLGQVVGYGTCVESFEPCAVLWENGNAFHLNDLVNPSTKGNWHLEIAVGINDNGWIVGSMYDTNNYSNSTFLLTPEAVSAVPEPSEFLLFSTGLAMLGLVVRRKKSVNQI